jgi:hypothetical protein
MSRMVVTRVRREFAAIEQADADRRTRMWSRAVAHWLDDLRLAWAAPPPPDVDRQAARDHLEWARMLGATYYEGGTDGLREFLAEFPVMVAGEVVTRLPDAQQEAVVAWAKALWPEGSRHPCDPDLPAHQRLGALDDTPPSPAVITAWRTRVAYFAHAPGEPRPAWPETAAGVTAHLCFLVTIQGEGAAGRQAVADWLVASGIHTPRKAQQQAVALAEDIATLRQRVAASGSVAARATVMDWYDGTTAAEADRILGCSGIAVDEAADTAAPPTRPPKAARRSTSRQQVSAAPAPLPAAPPAPPPPVAAEPVPTPPRSRPEATPSTGMLQRMARPERRMEMRERLERRYGPPMETPRRELDGWTVLERLARR